MSPLAYALFIRPPEVHWPVVSPASLFGWDPLLRIHLSGLSSVRGSILVYVEYYRYLKFGDSHFLRSLQSYIVVILFSSFILLLVAWLIVIHCYDDIESTLPMFLVSYCMKYVHD